MGKKRKSEEPEAVTSEETSKKRKKKHRSDKGNGKAAESSSEEPDATTAEKSTKKQKKKHRRNKENGKESSDIPTNGFDSTTETSTKSRLTQIEQLTRDLASDPESMREHLSDGGVEIADAIAELSRIFARTRPSLPKASPESQQSNNAPTHEPGKNGLPPLPLIQNKSLEVAAFTHHGTLGQQRTTPTEEVSYDRLEVLGDAYIEVFATRLIWDRFKTLPAGRLSQAREVLVNNETLAEYAVKYGFDKRTKVAPELIQQPKRWVKIRGDVFEAYVGAVILSNPLNGFHMAEDWLAQLWLPKLSDFQAGPTVMNAKEELGKKIMSRGVKLRYVDEKPVITNKGIKTFFIGAYMTGYGWTDRHLGSGTGLSKVAAGNEAAKQALANKGLIDKISAAKKAHDEIQRAERTERIEREKAADTSA